MKIAYEIKQFLKDPLKSFRTLQVILAIVCIAIPALLRIWDKDEFYPKKLKLDGIIAAKDCISEWEIDSTTKISKNGSGFQLSIKDYVLEIQIDSATRIRKDQFGFRTSVSDYVYSSNSYFFGVLYCMAAMLFIFKGAVYMNRLHPLKVNNEVHWYNIFIGVCLLGVVFCPYHDHFYVHTVFTVLFFVGNIYVMGFFPNPDETRVTRRMRKLIACLVVLALILSIRFKMVLWGEWFSLTVISMHLISVAISADYYNRPSIDNASHT